MKIAYFDCGSGVSGDMLLGALIDLGLDINSLSEMLRELGLSKFNIKADKVQRKGIGTVNLTVEVEHEHKHRHLKHIYEIVDNPVLSDNVRDSVRKVFEKVAAAEGKIHGIAPEKVHFHEVGALDSIIDIVGAVWGLEQLGIRKCYSSAITLGSGEVKCAHGIIPVPSPATLDIVKGFPVAKREIGSELATPTGAALVTTIAEYTYQLPLLKITGTGYGCGDRELENIPNILRIIAGETIQEYEQDSVMIIETNIDDMIPEIVPHLIDRLLNEGALDVFVTPVIMKKGRQGNQITVLCESSSLNLCSEILFSETTTSGIRISEAGRYKLPRKVEKLKTRWGEINVKSFIRDGKKKIVPEFEECRSIALKESIPLIDVYEEVRKTGNPDD
ncbi:MAG: nickel pincer cofactor biosynthesis protein LarC [bacterium]|nr:nickel pincer cofactor biosynthesis protein LarC [bacterium]